MEKYLSVEEMLAVERAADAQGHTYEKMMMHAGASLAEEIHNAYSQYGNRKILGLVGKGNNGGDALVAMTILMQRGWRANAYFTTMREDSLVTEFLQHGGRVDYFEEDHEQKLLKEQVKHTNVVLDGLLGTGIKLPLREPVPIVLKAVNQALEAAEFRPKVVAVDCPSGIDCDSGEASEDCIPADLTMCMAAVKRGLFSLPAYTLLGNLVIGDIGLPPGLLEWDKISRKVLDHTITQKIPPRPLSAHKGTFGTALVIAGSRSFTGAVLLSGRAAFRSGTGWVNMAVAEEIQLGLVGAFPEATWMPLPDYHGAISEDAAEVVLEALSKETALLIGPGMGLESTTQNFLEKLISPDLPPLVIDADALKLLANIDKWWEKLPEKAVLTPHPGEMSILCGLPVDEIQEMRDPVAEEWAKRWGHVVVLKGAFTVVADPGGETAILPVATPALSRAGTGDVLAGIIVGLRAQGMSAFDAACAGVWLHAEAGLLAAEELGSTAGVLAGDLIRMLPRLLPE